MCGRVGNPQLSSLAKMMPPAVISEVFASNNLFSRAVTTISYKSVQSIWYCSTNRDGHYHENWQLFGNGGHLRGFNKNERLLTREKWIEKSRFLPCGRLTSNQAKNFWHNIMKTLSKLASCSWMKAKGHINVFLTCKLNRFLMLPQNQGIFAKKLRFFPPLLLFSKTEIVYLRIRDLKFQSRQKQLYLAEKIWTIHWYLVHNLLKRPTDVALTHSQNDIYSVCVKIFLMVDLKLW